MWATFQLNYIKNAAWNSENLPIVLKGFEVPLKRPCWAAPHRPTSPEITQPQDRRKEPRVSDPDTNGLLVRGSYTP